MDGFDSIKDIADSLWDYIKKKHLVQELADSVRFYRAEVTTAPSDGEIGVTRPLDSEVTLPYASSAANLAVGEQCLVLVFGSNSNAIVFSDGIMGNYDMRPLKVVSSTFSSLPITISNSSIKSEMDVTSFVVSNTAAMLSDWTWTTADGSVTISGTIYGSTTITLYLEETRT